ncbi:WbqC family protein [Oceanisphaera sp. W20_SRM_FM3]|uniref:WbqC family protein n=1 Tax=Oceanisphaera sp. W20_SRM_FM3 TaxID=3240267 RepID=UPI003F995FDA
MKLAVMQPYLFPYIGYFQLIYATDLFMIYDDVAYIKQGYVNRNSILSANGATRLTIPVPGASSNKLISALEFSVDVEKVIKTISQSYSKAPYFDDVFPMIRGALELKDRTIATVCQKSYEEIFSYLGLEKQFKKTSELEYDRSASARDRLIALCHQFDADCYINAPGGRKLYAKQDFVEKGIDLKFIDSLQVVYSQGVDKFVPNLSIIDMLMNCPPSQVIEHMERYELG